MATFNVAIDPLGAAPSETSSTAVGICLSGGGSRALSCALGQLRGLRSLGLLDKVAAISSVSGGTWANVLFTYLPTSISDDDFLGPVVLDPSQLTLDELGKMGSNNLGQVPYRLGTLPIVAELAEYRLSKRYAPADMWQAVIGKLVLKDFGLWNPDATGVDPRYFTGTTQYLAEGPLLRNPQLSSDNFYTIRDGRPLPIFNTSVFINDSVTSDLVPFEANWLLGVRGVFNQPEQLGAMGGGLIESFAMGSDYIADNGADEVTTRVPLRAFSLNDIAGCSSMAPAQDFEEKFPEINGLVPRYPYWPVDGRESQPTLSYRFADGGNLENLGIMPLLARGIARLLVFVNSDQGVNIDPESGETVVADDLPPLFGLQPFCEKTRSYPAYANEQLCEDANGMFRHNQVFDTAAFDALKQGLLAAKKSGGSLLVRQTLSVLANDWFNVPAQQSVEVLWVYNDLVRAWWKQLPDETQADLDLQSVDDFPLYGTVTQLHLSYTLVNALAHLSYWNLASDSTVGNPDGQSNADVVRGMFA
ncbi:hypothetical protein LMG31886_03340 [Xanthomonas hydrangeae]|uniref:hypothetical protein n=1 Tax=Xanthomonas hydrangeae TaxID=2775159 RepID=UPI001966C04B|nr:hypothetical protein LMG31884_03370 [Xanthomonas hydrangeae]CAD7712910.1 hypothetical protein LMG31884_03370 [Xanthomonas hydrangeae]CAD7718389.1 hypothetical protein LMG31887_03360 [Xanthomonas hydrangeae]CAD7718391.1 hypothetical protein LMG31887_03360 [Xanthomonas hydrangeae]CAD7721982.1 hypothetical protein LMG31886_03340 [Xanthomonas hydrangeae]